jgi:hypothetical protein
MTLRQRDIDPCRLVDDLTHILIDNGTGPMKKLRLRRSSSM